MNSRTENISQLEVMISARACGLACCQRLVMEDMLLLPNHTVTVRRLILTIALAVLVSPLVAHADASPRRLTSVRYKTWIWAKPIKHGRFLGYMRVGQQVALRSTELVRGQGCPGGFYRVQPRGFVCNDVTVTLKESTPFLTNNAFTLPEAGPHPYRFAISNGAPMYSRLPSQQEQKRHEWRYGKVGEVVALPLFQRGHEHLAVTDPIVPSGPVPPFLAAGVGARGATLSLLRRSIPRGAMMAYTRAFDVDGRTFLLSSDLTVVPADRVRRFRKSQFHGTRLGQGVQLPLAWFRVKARPKYQLDGDVVQPTGEHWPVRSFVGLSGKRRAQGKQTFLETREGHWVDGADVTIARDYGKRPFAVKPGDKWIMVSIMGGTLVAYDDLTPVYATLMSPGQGGVPRKGGDNVKNSTTPLGIYPITFKDRAATMSPEFGDQRSFWIADVPFTQYFNAPFALHTAYWHERFGEPMSGGCINVSPIDGEWLFEWTEPHVPAGWQGATGAGAKANGNASWIVVRR